MKTIRLRADKDALAAAVARAVSGRTTIEAEFVAGWPNTPALLRTPMSPAPNPRRRESHRSSTTCKRM